MIEGSRSDTEQKCTVLPEKKQRIFFKYTPVLAQLLEVRVRVSNVKNTKDKGSLSIILIRDSFSFGLCIPTCPFLPRVISFPNMTQRSFIYKTVFL